MAGTATLTIHTRIRGRWALPYIGWLVCRCGKRPRWGLVRLVLRWLIARVRVECSHDGKHWQHAERHSHFEVAR